jgi:hypothetical protein
MERITMKSNILRKTLVFATLIITAVSVGHAQTADTPDAAMNRLRLNPDLARPVVLTSFGGTASLLVAPVDDDVAVFVPNPADPRMIATVDDFGTFTLFTGSEGQGLPAPFTPFAPADRASNDKLVVNAHWSEDGETLALVLDNPDRKSAEDVIYWWEIGVTGANHIMHSCRAGAQNCNFFVSADGEPANWYATSAAWSPDGEWLLGRVFMESVGREGFILLNRGSDRTRRDPVCAFEFSAWSRDGQSVVVSGRDADGFPTLGTITPDCRRFTASDVHDLGWETHSGVMREDGTLVALARSNRSSGPYRMVDGYGTDLTEDIGVTAPVQVVWNDAADSAFVRTEDGRAYVALITGAVSEVTQAAGAAQMVAWLDVP